MENEPSPSQTAAVGAEAIGGVTAGLIKKAGWEPMLVCRHQAIVDRIRDHGLIIRGTKSRHRILLTAVRAIQDGSRLISMANLDGPVFNRS